MTKFEKRILLFFDKKINYIMLFFIIILGILIRICLRNIISNDMSAYYLKWYDEYSNSGGLKGLDHQVGDYNFLYQFIFAIITYIPIKSLYSIKLVSIIFDFILAFFLSKIVSENTIEDNNKQRNFIISFSIVFLSPIVFLNSAAWGQSDAIYTSFCFASLYYLIRGKTKKSFIMLGIAFSFKLQAVFILPFYLFYYVYKKNYSIFNFLFIPLMMILTAIPNIIAGRNVADIIKVYFTQTNSTAAMYSKYPSFWCFLSEEKGGDFDCFYIYKNVGILFAICVLAFLMYYLYKKVKEINTSSLINIAFIFIYTTILFLPSMQERYGYMYESLSIAVAIKNKKTIPLAIILNMMTIYQYGGALGIEKLPIPLAGLSWINIAVWCTYLFMLVKDCQNDEKKYE